MSQLLLVNPRKRTRTMRKKRRTPKQIAATKRMVAANRARARLKRNPIARAKPNRKRAAVKRTAPKQKRYLARSTANRAKSTRRPGYYPNPARRNTTRKGMVANVIDRQIKPAAMMASGALLLDIGYGYLGGYIPAMLNTGMARHATKGVIAVGLSYLMSNFVKQSTANELAKGALVVTMHDALKEGLQTFAPSIPLGYYNASPVYGGDMGYFSSDNADGFSNKNLGYFSDDNGSGFTSLRGQETFDTSSI